LFGCPISLTDCVLGDDGLLSLTILTDCILGDCGLLSGSIFTDSFFLGESKPVCLIMRTDCIDGSACTCGSKCFLANFGVNGLSKMYGVLRGDEIREFDVV
jgi:hypothetical protein